MPSRRRQAAAVDDGLVGQLFPGRRRWPCGGCGRGPGEPVLAGGGEGHGAAVEQGGQVGDAGQGRQGGEVRAGRARPAVRFRVRRGAGAGQDGVVPLAVDAWRSRTRSSRYFICSSLTSVPAGVGAVVEDGGDLQARRGGGRGDAGHGVFGGHQGPGPPGAGDVAEQPVLDLVPLGGAGREVAHRDLQAGLGGQRGQLVFPQPAPVAVGAAGVAGDQQPPRARVAQAALAPATTGAARSPRTRRCRGWCRRTTNPVFAAMS